MAQIEGVWGQSQQGSGGGLLHFLLLRKALLILASGRLLICGLITRSRSAERPPEASKAASHRGTVCALAPSVDLPWSKALNPEGLAVLSCFKVCEWPADCGDNRDVSWLFALPRPCLTCRTLAASPFCFFSGFILCSPAARRGAAA